MEDISIQNCDSIFKPVCFADDPLGCGAVFSDAAGHGPGRGDGVDGAANLDYSGNGVKVSKLDLQGGREGGVDDAEFRGELGCPSEYIGNLHVKASKDAVEGREGEAHVIRAYKRVISGLGQIRVLYGDLCGKDLGKLCVFKGQVRDRGGVRIGCYHFIFHREGTEDIHLDGRIKNEGGFPQDLLPRGVADGQREGPVGAELRNEDVEVIAARHGIGEGTDRFAVADRFQGHGIGNRAAGDAPLGLHLRSRLDQLVRLNLCATHLEGKRKAKRIGRRDLDQEYVRRDRRQAADAVGDRRLDFSLRAELRREVSNAAELVVQEGFDESTIRIQDMPGHLGDAVWLVTAGQRQGRLDGAAGRDGGFIQGIRPGDGVRVLARRHHFHWCGRIFLPAAQAVRQADQELVTDPVQGCEGRRRCGKARGVGRKRTCRILNDPPAGRRRERNAFRRRPEYGDGLAGLGSSRVSESDL